MHKPTATILWPRNAQLERHPLCSCGQELDICHHAHCPRCGHRINADHPAYGPAPVG